MSPTQYQVLAHLLWQNNLREKKKKKSLSATALNYTVLRLLRSTVELTLKSQLKKTFVSWLDNGVVTFASTFAGVEPIDQVRRWSESAKEHIMIDRPHSISLYNNYMGGVDNIHYLISLYRIKVKTRKWPVRMFFISQIWLLPILGWSIVILSLNMVH